MSTKKVMLLLALFSTIFFVTSMLSGCATTPSPRALSVQDADYRQVEHCQFIGDVHGSSGFGGLASSIGIQNAKNEAREKAASIEATHIVWGHAAGGWGATAGGKAYRCK